jgi:hypothetical protein
VVIAQKVAWVILQTIADRLKPMHKDDYPRKFHITTTRVSDAIAGDFRQTVILLFGSVALLLSIPSRVSARRLPRLGRGDSVAYPSLLSKPFAGNFARSRASDFQTRDALQSALQPKLDRTGGTKSP